MSFFFSKNINEKNKTKNYFARQIKKKNFYFFPKKNHYFLEKIYKL